MRLTRVVVLFAVLSHPLLLTAGASAFGVDGAFGERRAALAAAAELRASGALRPGEVGLRYRAALRATRGKPPFRWSIARGSLPRGLTLNRATGAVTGIPRVGGTFELTFAVADAAGQRASARARLRIAPPLVITNGRLPAATAGKAYRTRLTSTGGLAPKTWRIVRGSLPPGIKLDRRTGVLSGVTRRTGVFVLTVRVTDRIGGRSRRVIGLAVRG